MRKYRQTQSDTAKTYYEKYMSEMICEDSQGSKLKKEVLATKIENLNIFELCEKTPRELSLFFKNIIFTGESHFSRNSS